jgi:5'-deoxynucleotidase YfbR-like HD superfamily hydrolase
MQGEPATFLQGHPPHSSARVVRWNRQTSSDHAFSVAEHSVVAELC